MKGLDKLKSRTEWQAYLMTIVIIFLDQFLDIGMDPEHLIALVGSTFGYGVSRGLAKYEKSDNAKAEQPALQAAEKQDADQEGATQDS